MKTSTFFFSFLGFYAIEMDVGPHNEIADGLLRSDKYIYFISFQVYLVENPEKGFKVTLLGITGIK